LIDTAWQTRLHEYLGGTIRGAARLPKGQVGNPNSESGLLRRQIQRQKGHMPVRALLHKLPNLLPRSNHDS
jgi:hypothetical protein